MTNKEKATIDQLSSGYRSGYSFDVERGLSRLHDDLGISTSDQQAVFRSLPRQNRRSWLAIAASVVVLVCASFYVATSLGSKTTFEADTQALEVSLPDGSVATLKPGSTLAYAKVYGENERRIELDGEAYFSVEPDANRPFLVSQNDVTLRVVGTTFNLMADPAQKVFEVEVSSGKVMLETPAESMPISAKECGRVDSDKISKMLSPNLNRHAWRTGILIFEATPFSEVIDAIERTYDITLKVTKKDLERCDFPLTATFENADLEDVITHLEKLTSGKFLYSESRKVYRLINWCE